jgi:hypothetical protein
MLSGHRKNSTMVGRGIPRGSTHGKIGKVKKGSTKNTGKWNSGLFGVQTVMSPAEQLKAVELLVVDQNGESFLNTVPRKFQLQPNSLTWLPSPPLESLLTPC